MKINPVYESDYLDIMCDSIYHVWIRKCPHLQWHGRKRCDCLSLAMDGIELPMDHQTKKKLMYCPTEFLP